MTRRQSFFAYAALLVGVVAFASSFARPTSGQQGAPGQAAFGRYHLATSVTGNVDHVYVTDTVTGRTWTYQRGHEWFDMGTPVPAK